MRRIACVLMCAAAGACTTGAPSTTRGPTNATAAETAAMAAISGDAIRARMEFLADDALEGRGTASRGYEIAAKYVAAEFAAMGVAPAR